MKQKLLLFIFFLPTMLFSQIKIFLDQSISITMGKEFREQNISVEELNKFIDNEKIEKFFIKEKVYLENQTSFNITNPKNPKSFININLIKITLPEKVDNSTMNKSEEIRIFFTNYIDEQVSNNFDKFGKGSAKFINKTKLNEINGINILQCQISTSLKVKQDDVLNANTDIIYIFNDKSMIILSIDKTENDYAVWNKISKNIINSIQKE